MKDRKAIPLHRLSDVWEAFNALVEKSDGCWAWKGKTAWNFPYGLFSIDNNNYLAHRLAFAFEFGADPGHLDVCHSCDNPNCVKPDHFFLGTHTDNMQDMIRKNRRLSPSGENHSRSKLKSWQIPVIRELFSGGTTLIEIAGQFDVSKRTVLNVVKNRIWKDAAFIPVAVTTERKTGRKLSNEQISQIVKLRLTSGLSLLAIAGRFGVSKRTILNVVHGRIYKHEMVGMK